MNTNMILNYSSDIIDRLLFNCVRVKDYELVEILLSKQADINSRLCVSSVCYAVNNEDIETVKLFLEKGFNVNSKDEIDNTALHYAVLSNNNNITQLLVDYKADIKECDGYLLLHAVKANNIDIIKILLNNGINVNYVNDKGYTALHYAVENNKLDIVNLLLGKGANIEIVNECSFINNIIKFRFTNYYNMIELMLSYKANVNNIHDNYAPLHLAIDEEDEEIIKLLIRYGADINIKNTYNDSSPLHHAVKSVNKNILKILLDKGADVNSLNRYGCTPIYYAVCNNNIDVVNILLEYGADVNVIDLSGNTPLTVSGNNYIKKEIISHIVISKYLNKFIVESPGYKRNIECIYLDKVLVDIKSYCENEITALRNIKISECNNNLLECIIRKDINTISKFIDDDKYQKYFPIYGILLKKIRDKMFKMF
ncbi:SWPV1-008 [Shearwaterpox virus]|uniref:SWPV1-008 n=1 Tax=Shearwaterpox virus TaxID=1974596 RepID=A0A1V0S7N3_CNPV|nr:SWPV1-008 [Shearwaterpox virus]